MSNHCFAPPILIVLDKCYLFFTTYFYSIGLQLAPKKTHWTTIHNFCKISTSKMLEKYFHIFKMSTKISFIAKSVFQGTSCTFMQKMFKSRSVVVLKAILV